MTSYSGLTAAIRVIVSEHAPGPKRIRFPKRGPYYKRRLRRTSGDPKNWSDPEFFMINGNTIICHPHYEYILRARLCAQGVEQRWEG